MLCVLLYIACGKPAEDVEDLRYSSLQLPAKPNIVWIVAEDLSPIIPVFGDSTVSTPHIDRLAREGVVYTRFFSPSGVCAPSRAAIATGIYPTRIGAHHMRTGPWFRFHTTDQAIQNYPRKAYEAMPPEGTHMLSTYLRARGYYCSNNPKEDYQFRCEMTAWDDSSFEAHWKNRQPGHPFFAIFNLDHTHESMIWRKAREPLLIDSTLEVPIPPYLPETPVAQRDVRRLYSQLKLMDERVGEILSELEAANLMDSTIIFWYTDHGGPLPRQKRTIYDSGLHIPMIIRFPKQQFAGSIDSALHSFIDLKPTVMSLLGIEPPDYVDGKAWMGQFKDAGSHRYIFAAADRFDHQTDRIRAVRNRRFKLVRNYHTDRPYYLPVRYRETMPIMQELLRLRGQDSLTAEQQQWFRPVKDSLELFDLHHDPFEFDNLIEDNKYRGVVAELKAALDAWIEETDDKGKWPEEEYIRMIWPDGSQPVTANPVIAKRDSHIIISCPAGGATVGYQWAVDEDHLTRTWTLYQAPISVKRGMNLYVRSHRIGYRPSALIEKNVN